MKSDKPTITFDAKAIDGKVSPLLFGINHRWCVNGTGSADPKTGLTYPRVVEQIKDVGFTMIRYPGGTLANAFQWQRAIGPQEKRDMQVGAMMAMPGPHNSTFGPDEFGDLLDKTGATGNLMVNFATATAADAANFVAYMTAPAGSPKVNSMDWAAKRAANGHPAPYKIAYVEVGNEYEPAIQPYMDQNYWIKGEAVGFTPANNVEKICKLYAFGGSTRFTEQPVVQLTDWREPTSISSGEKKQTVYAQYAPVTKGSDTVFVDETAWKRVADLTKEGPDAKVYQLDGTSGAITFGDGAHGAIPPKGAKVTVSYISGPHDGFVDFYRAIKAANPEVKVMASIVDPTFIKLMGSEHPYDGIQQHPYVVANPKTDKSKDLPDYFIQTAHGSMHLGAEVQATQAAIKKYAGARADKIDMLLSEYGELGVFPSYSRHFVRSQGQGVMHAICVRQWVLNHVASADRTLLTDFTYAPIPADLAAVQISDSDTGGNFALLAGPGPDTIVNPVGWSMKLLKNNTGDTLIASKVADSPQLKSAKGDSVPALQTYATLDAKGNAYLVVINADPRNDIVASVAASNFTHGPKALVTTLASPNINDENTPKEPMKVTLKNRTVDVGEGRFEMTFPRHSVTAIKLSPR